MGQIAIAQAENGQDGAAREAQNTHETGDFD